jgi:YfiH family protein
MSTPMDTIISGQQSAARNQQKSEDEILAENGFYWREKDGVKILVCKPLEENGFINGFSTRLGGVSPFPENSLNLAGFDEDTGTNIRENRLRFLKLFDGDFLLATVWQIHSDKIIVLKDEEDILLYENEKADSLVSNISQVLVGAKTADCVPVLIGDPETKAFAAVHAGWRGTVQSIVVKTVEKMREVYGTNPANLICAIGAAATCKNYEIGQDVIDAFAENFPGSTHLFTPTGENHAKIDLHTANKEQLISLDVSEANLFPAPFCTMERNDLFFSYRLEKKTFGKTGRLLSVIGRK